MWPASIIDIIRAMSPPSIMDIIPPVLPIELADAVMPPICSARSVVVASRAMISFPERRYGISCSSQYAYSSRAPSTHNRAFSEPGS